MTLYMSTTRTQIQCEQHIDNICNISITFNREKLLENLMERFYEYYYSKEDLKEAEVFLNRIQNTTNNL